MDFGRPKHPSQRALGPIKFRGFNFYLILHPSYRTKQSFEYVPAQNLCDIGIVT